MKNPSDRSSSPTVFRLNFYIDIKNDPDLAYVAHMDQRGHRGFETLRLMRLGLAYDRLIKEQATATARSVSAAQAAQAAQPTPAPVASPTPAHSHAPAAPTPQPQPAPATLPPAHQPERTIEQYAVATPPRTDNVMPNRAATPPQHQQRPVRQTLPQQQSSAPAPRPAAAKSPAKPASGGGAPSRLHNFLSDGSAGG